MQKFSRDCSDERSDYSGCIKTAVSIYPAYRFRYKPYGFVISQGEISQEAVRTRPKSRIVLGGRDRHKAERNLRYPRQACYDDHYRSSWEYRDIILWGKEFSSGIVRTRQNSYPAHNQPVGVWASGSTAIQSIGPALQ
jgi:hypothetical protein